MQKLQLKFFFSVFERDLSLCGCAYVQDGAGDTAAIDAAAAAASAAAAALPDIG